MADKECGCADDERCFDCATDSELAAAVPPYVVNPEAIGNPGQTPIVQLPAATSDPREPQRSMRPPVSDPREELRSVIENAVMAEPRVMEWEGAAATAVLAAGYVKPALDPSQWWRVIAPDGSLWAETSSEREARERVRPGDRLERLYVAEVSEWRSSDESQYEPSTSAIDWFRGGSPAGGGRFA